MTYFKKIDSCISHGNESLGFGGILVILVYIAAIADCTSMDGAALQLHTQLEKGNVVVEI